MSDHVDSRAGIRKPAGIMTDLSGYLPLMPGIPPDYPAARVTRLP